MGGWVGGLVDRWEVGGWVGGWEDASRAARPSLRICVDICLTLG